MIQPTQVPWLTPTWIKRLLQLADGAGSLIDADKLDSLESTDFLRSSVAWIALPYTTGATTWTDYGSGYLAGAYRKVGDIVELRGLCYRTMGTGNVIATLPVGYRPSSYALFTTSSNDAYSRVDVQSGGAINIVVGTPAAWVCLDPIRFSTL